MSATFIHLSGTKRGEVEIFADQTIKVGSAADCQLLFDPQSNLPVRAVHAEIRVENCEYVLTDRAQGTFVNNRMVPEIILQDGDMIEFGAGGPKVRFRIRPDDRPCKPFREICADCIDSTFIAAGNRLAAFPSFVKAMLREVYREASWRVKVSVFSILFLMVGSILGSPALLYKAYRKQISYEKSLLRLSGELHFDRLSQKALEKNLSDANERMAHFQDEADQSLTRLHKERERLEAQIKESSRILQARDKKIRDMETQLTMATRKIRALEQEKGAGANIIQKFKGGVAFVEVTYAFEDSLGRRIRFLRVDSSGEPLRDSNGQAMVSIEGQGPVLYLHSSGTGFLVEPGKLLTNRHVAEPWWGDEEVQRFINSGFRPLRVLFRAFFPEVQKPFTLIIEHLSEKADVALARFDPRGVKLPVLSVDASPTAAIVGKPIILIGYPAGVEALLARVDPIALKNIFDMRGSMMREITQELSHRGLIRPLTTWGHLSDVQPHQVTYDALTTSGASGSPILNTQGKVIGINQAILRNFSGSNFGIPIRFGQELLGQN